MSLQEVIKRYEATKKGYERNAQLVKEVIEQNIETETIKALKIQNHKVNQIHKNQQLIENRLRKNQELQSELRRNQEIWVGLYDGLNKVLKQAGDLNHYANYVGAEISQLVGEGSLKQFMEETEREGLNLTKKTSSQGSQKKEQANEKVETQKQEEKIEESVF